MAESSRAWGTSSAEAGTPEVKFVVLSTVVKLAFPPLLFSSIPKRAIGFSYPSGGEGRLLGISLLGVTGVLGFLLSTWIGPAGDLVMAWLLGGTAVVMIYNSTSCRIAFLKEYCAPCRLRPIIEEHEAMHLNGEASEDVIWQETRRRYTYESLSLEGDPQICTFCPIAKKLRNV